MIVLSLPGIRCHIVPARAKKDYAHARAMQQFLAQGLHLTERRTDVLVFASIAEGHAEIITDVGINAEIGPEV